MQMSRSVLRDDRSNKGRRFVRDENIEVIEGGENQTVSDYEGGKVGHG